LSEIFILLLKLTELLFGILDRVVGAGEEVTFSKTSGEFLHLFCSTLGQCSVNLLEVGFSASWQDFSGVLVEIVILELVVWVQLLLDYEQLLDLLLVMSRLESRARDGLLKMQLAANSKLLTASSDLSELEVSRKQVAARM